jgi:hypothetical protein
MAWDFGTLQPFWIPPICRTTFINCTKGGEKKCIENTLGKIEKGICSSLGLLLI